MSPSTNSAASKVYCCLLLLLWLVAGSWLSEPVLADEQEVVTFRSAVVPSAVATGINAQADRAVLRAFLREHPNIRVERFSMPEIEGGGMDAGPLMAISAGLPPHAIYVNFRQSSTYINRGFLEPLEILLARVRSDNERVRQTDENDQWLEDPTQEEVDAALAAIRERVADPVWPVIYRTPDDERVAQQEHVWSMPTDTLVKALVYRRDLFHDAGLDPDRPPENWEELREYAQAIRDPDLGRFGVLVPGGTNTSYGIYNFLVSYGVRAMEQDEDGRWRATFNTPEAARTILYVWQLVNEQFERDGRTMSQALRIETSGQIRGLLWERGLAGMRFEYLDEDLMSDTNPQLTGIAPVPKGPTGERGAEVNARMLGVFADSTPQQKLAVMRYIWFLTGEEAQRMRTSIYVRGGYGRFVNPDHLERFGYYDLLERVPEGWREAFDAAMEGGVPEPYGRNTQHIYRDMSGPINWALSEELGRLTEERALELIQERLDTAAERVDRHRLGEIPAEEMAQRRVLGGLLMGAIVALFVGSLIWVWRSFTKAEREERLGEDVPLRRFFWGYVLLAPALVFIISWEYLPLTGGIVLALYDFELVLASTFIGVDNFANILFDYEFWASLGRTFYFVALVIGLGFWPPILLALLLDEVPTETFKYFFRTIFYLPQIVSGVIMIFLWRQLYDDSESGFLNQIIMSVNVLDPVSATLLKWVGLALWFSLIGLLIWLPIRMDEMTHGVRACLWAAALGLLAVTFYPVVDAFTGPSAVELEALAREGENVSEYVGFSAVLTMLSALVGGFNVPALEWINSRQMAMLCAVIPMIWATAGPGCIIYLAAMKTVPRDLYESAAIDGAGFWHRICYITLPRLKFLIMIQFIAAVIGSFKGGADFILALTGGGPQGATRVLELDIFERTFMDLRFGMGAAMAWFLGGMLIVFTAYQLKLLSRAAFAAPVNKEAQGGNN